MTAAAVVVVVAVSEKNSALWVVKEACSACAGAIADAARTRGCSSLARAAPPAEAPREGYLVHNTSAAAGCTPTCDGCRARGSLPRLGEGSGRLSAKLAAAWPRYPRIDRTSKARNFSFPRTSSSLGSCEVQPASYRDSLAVMS